jgi:hypothetical protein
VVEEEDALAGAGLAGPGGSSLEAQGHVHDPQSRHADQQLQEDLETDRAELDAVDEAAPAEEIPRKRVGALAGFLEEDLGDQAGAAADQVTGQPGQAAGAPPRDVPAGHHQVRARLRGGEHLGDQLRGVLEVRIHDADEIAPCHVETGDDGGAQPPRSLGTGPEQAADLGVRRLQGGQPGGGRVVAVIDEADLGADAGKGGLQPRPEGCEALRLVARGDHHREPGRGIGHWPQG